jgi:hypothetical protein
VDPATHSTDGDCRGESDLLIGEPDHIAENDRLSEVDRKLEKSFLDVVTQRDAGILDIGGLG